MPTTATLKRPSPARIIEPTTPPATGDNGPSDDDLIFFAGQFRAADEKIKEAGLARKKLRQAAKLRGVELQHLDEIIEIMEQDDDTFIDGLKTKQRYARAFDLPVGWQFELFGMPRAGDGQAAYGLNEKAFKNGYQRGVAGLNPDDQAYPPMTNEGQEHLKGWHEGQAVNHVKFLKLNEEMAAAAAAKEAKKQAKADAAEDTQH